MDFATLRLQPFNILLFLTSSFPVVALVNKDREILQLLLVSSCSFSFFGWNLGFFCFTGKSFPPYQILIPIFLQPLSRDFPRGTKPSETIPEGKAEGFPPLQNFKPKLKEFSSSSFLNSLPVAESLWDLNREFQTSCSLLGHSLAHCTFLASGTVFYWGSTLKNV